MAHEVVSKPRDWDLYTSPLVPSVSGGTTY